MGCDIQPECGSKLYIRIDPIRPDYNGLFQEHKFDVCINCSGAANVAESVLYPEKDFSLNVQNVQSQLAAIALHNPLCKYLNMSSAAVYGNPEYLPIDEEHPLNPISPYGKHKKMAEDLCHYYHLNHGLNTCVVRIFSAYGEGLKKQLFWDLGQKTKNPPVVLYGSGNESRDFVHAADVVAAIAIVVAKSKFDGDVVNVARGEEISIREAAETFYGLFDNSIGFTFGGEERIGDPINWVANIAKLKSMGFDATIDLKSGLARYVSWLVENE